MSDIRRAAVHGARQTCTQHAPAVRPDPGASLPEVAGDLVASLMSESWGQVSPSVYETGRVVSLTPG